MEVMTTYSSILRQAIRSSNFPRVTQKKDLCQTYHRERCKICPAIDLLYKDELSVKEESFREFWRINKLPGTPEKIIHSPMGRGYRTVSKRRAFRDGRGQVLLGLTDVSESGRIKPLDVKACPIEPPLHASIYNYVQQFIVSRNGNILSKVLSHVIVKGNYEEYWVVFNISDMSREIGSTLTQLSKNLTKEFNRISGLFYTVEEHTKYYLSDKAQNYFKKIYGKDDIFHKVEELSLLFSPLAFSQTNSSIVAPMITKASELMGFQKEDTLYDLYCGYGLFGLSAASQVRTVIGIEISTPSVRSAIQNAKRNKIGNVRFFTENITVDSLNRVLPHGSKRELVILDPPRNGTEEGVIEYLAERKVLKALHLFCEVDLIPQELSRWKQGSYYPKRVVPLDMFPATDAVEIMIVLERI